MYDRIAKIVNDQFIYVLSTQKAAVTYYSRCCEQDASIEAQHSIKVVLFSVRNSGH